MKKICFLLAVVFSFGTLRAQDTIYATTIVNHNDLDLRYENLVVMPTMGVYLADENRLESLSDRKASSFMFPEGMVVDDLVWVDTDFVVKSYNNLYWMRDLSKPLQSFDDASFLVFPRDEKSIYIVLHHGDNSSLFFFNVKVKGMKRLVTVPGWVVSVAGNEKATMIVTEMAAWMFADGKCVPYMSFWPMARSAVMTNKGLVCVTDDELLLMLAPYKYDILEKGKFEKVLYDHRNIYVVTGDGDLLKIEW